MLGVALLVIAGLLAGAGLPYFLNETAESQGDDALLAGRTLLMALLIGLGALGLAGMGVVLWVFRGNPG
jgi:hypothetical protein